MQVRALLEGVTSHEILEHWAHILAQKMADWQLDRGELVQLFGDVRDEWMQQDLQGWLEPNEIYPGVAQPLRDAIAAEHTEVYIVTTKQVNYRLPMLLHCMPCHCV